MNTLTIIGLSILIVAVFLFALRLIRRVKTMRMWTVNSEGTHVSASVPLSLVPELIGQFSAGHPVCLGAAGMWVFPEYLLTESSGVRKLTHHGAIKIKTGLDPRDPSKPGDCDARWFECWSGDELVKRSVDILAHGVDVKFESIAGQAG